MNKLPFKHKILLVGYGSVAQCTLPILVRHIRIPHKRITVMDFEDKSRDLKPWRDRGVKWVHNRITPQNMGSLLRKYLSAGDLLIDLAWNIDCCEILQWCHKHGVMYINTSVEQWDPYEGADRKSPTELTLYWRHMKIQRMCRNWNNKTPSAVIEHGANPGLISHWTKQGLADIARKLLSDHKVKGRKAELVRHHLKRRQFNYLAKEMGVKVIHCSEKDTQVANVPKAVNEFVNTWSVEGFREEGTTTSEIGWGTHEKELPPRALRHWRGPKNQICLAQMGIHTWVRSWVPNYTIHGMVVRHGEAFTISDHLTVFKDGKPVYRPTVNYAYCPSDVALISLVELRGRDYVLQPKVRIMNDEIVSGSDILGALIMGHPYKSWWTGSDLSIQQSRKLVPHQNATTMQVAISVVAACCWMIENPDLGVCVPDDLPYEYVLKIAQPYLGNNLSIPSDWTPLEHITRPFREYAEQDRDLRDPWQFKNFLVQEGL